MGDPAGVGAEITIAAWRQRETLPPFFLIDDPDRIAMMCSEVPVQAIGTPEEAGDVFASALPVLPMKLDHPVRPGRPHPGLAKATIASIELAVRLARDGHASGMVTNPINKKVLYDGAGFRWPGHTEFLAHLGGVNHTVMMLAAPGLRVVPVTIHIALADVPGLLTADLIMQTARMVYLALQKDFDIDDPRLAVAGLNPHAGEGGAMGSEEVTIIQPAVDHLRSEGMDVRGPLPADTMFHPAAREKYDAALTMYHDQGLVPLKMLDFARGVNVTLGLPFVRTSPDHGTAYDIAGTGKADPTSLVEAIKLAGTMAKARGL